MWVLSFRALGNCRGVAYRGVGVYCLIVKGFGLKSGR